MDLWLRILAGCFFWLGAFVQAEESPATPWSVELKKKAVDRITAVWAEEEKEWVLDLSDRVGIGGLKLNRLSDATGKGLRIRLRLKGLEQFRLTAGKQVITYSVSSTGKGRHRCSRGGKAIPADDPWRIEVKIKGKGEAGKDQKASAIPLGPDQWFEFVLPEKWLKEKEIALRWVDFFR